MTKLIVYGNPVDGFFYVGPFDSDQDAIDYMETELHKENCWIADLYRPADDSDEAKALAFVEGTEPN